MNIKWIPKVLTVLLVVSAVVLMVMLSGCGSTVQPTVGSGQVEDKTLSGNTVDFLTLLRVQNNYGTVITVSDSDGGKVSR